MTNYANYLARGSTGVPADGDVPTWNEASGVWQPAAVTSLAPDIDLGTTAETDTTKYLNPDGAGGVQWTVPADVDTGIGVDGWVAVGQTLAYGSADAPTFTATCAGVDLTGVIGVGMRIKLTQTTAKYFIVTAIAFSTNTTITLYGGTDYTLANAAITSPSYSPVKAPLGFPTNPAKWTVSVAVAVDTLDIINTVTNWLSSAVAVTIVIPIGAWVRSYQQVFSGHLINAGGVQGSGWVVGLSGVNNDFNIDALTAQGQFGGTYTAGVDTTVTFGETVRMQDEIVVAAKTTYYANADIINSNSPSAHTIGDNSFSGGPGLYISAVSAYL